MGGVCFLLNGNMIGGADRAKTGERRFMFRVGKEREAEAAGRPGAEVVNFSGRRMGSIMTCGEGAFWASMEKRAFMARVQPGAFPFCRTDFPPK